jgi:hypothetical protein
MHRRLIRVALALPLLASGVGVASGAAMVGPAAPLCAQAASTHRVGLVVEHGDGRVIRICVGFNTATITALTVLQSSGLEIGTESYGSLGTAVCQIDHEPPQYTTCLPATGSYWVLFLSHAGGAWATSARGASSATVADGDDVGFRYDPQAGADPPPPSPAGTCQVATPSPVPTPTPAPTARVTPAPGATPAPGVTPTSHVTPPHSASAGSTATSVTAPTASPAAGVLGSASPAASAAPLGSLARGSRQPQAVNTGLIVAAVGAAGLVGLLGLQGLRRRRQ